MAKLSDKELEKVHKAFANRRRVAIVRYLTTHKHSNLGSIAEHIKLSYKSTSKHLSQLANTGVLEKDLRSGIFYFSVATDLPAVARYSISLL